MKARRASNVSAATDADSDLKATSLSCWFLWLRMLPVVYPCLRARHGCQTSLSLEVARQSCLCIKVGGERTGRVPGAHSSVAGRLP
jgi:hypothetical protein